MAVVARAAVALAAGCVAACGSGGTATVPPSVAAPAPREIAIDGYGGTTMEPFVSRDGRFLLFNNSNDPGVDTDLQ